VLDVRASAIVEWDAILNKPSTFPSKLSQLTIDTDKDWNDKMITNAGLFAAGRPRGSYTNAKFVGVGNTSDFIVPLQDGTGRVNFYWNATPGTDPKYIVGDENAGKITFSPPSDPFFTVYWADGSGAAAGDPIHWQKKFAVRQNGDVEVSKIKFGDGTEMSSIYDAGVITFSTPTVHLGDGEILQLARFGLPAGKVFKVLKAQVARSNGLAHSLLVIEVFDVTYNRIVYSTSSPTVQEGAPLATSEVGVNIQIRIRNKTGAAVDCQGFVVGAIV